MPNRK